MQKKAISTIVLFLYIFSTASSCIHVEAAMQAPSNCGDGRDNDSDGLIDIAEPWCHSDLDANDFNSYIPYELGEFRSIGSAPSINSLKQYKYDGSEEIHSGALINENKISLRVLVYDYDREDEIALHYKGYCLENPNVTFSGRTFDFYPSGSWVDIKVEGLDNCRYVWKVIAYDLEGNLSGYKDFGNNSISEPDFVVSDDFSFVHITDVHFGSNKAFLATTQQQDWYESQSYPRFTDLLYEIETKVSPRPDFILVSGDDVEYNNITWLRDFKAITDDFSKRTGIKVYVVPGNHDRYDSESTAFSYKDGDFSGGNDRLRNYFEVMGDNQEVISFFGDNSDIMDDDESKDGGLNKYNYYFNHKGVQFIGLDSGEDTGIWDLTPESSGLHDYIVFLKLTLQNSSDFPKIIFFHNPVYNDKGLSSERDENSDMNEFIPNESFIRNHRNFIDYCNDNNVQLVLSGHTHQNKIFDESGNLINLSNWNGDYPLYIQTQSATKDSDGGMHGYRVIDVMGGKAIPREPVSNVTKYTKIVSDLDTSNNLTVATYDRSGQRVTIQNPGKTVPFFATASGRTIMYEDTGMSRFTIGNYNDSYGEYDFLLQKRDEGMEPQGDKWSFSGVKIKNPELCKGNPDCASFLAMRKEDGQKVNTLDFWGMDIDKQVEHAIEVNWVELQNSSLTQRIDGLKFVVNNNYNTTYERMPWVHVIDLNSPGELRVYGADGKVTGLVNGEVKSEIPYSFYVPETESVFLFGDTEDDVAGEIKTQVVGSYSATYDLSFSLQENDEEKAKVFADDIPTNGKTTHQFSVDWQALSEDRKGVNMQFDENDDGEFEKSLVYGSLVTANFLTADAGGDYESVEGSEVVFDASKSLSSSGVIILYEWDFDGDGLYDASSSVPTISHAYGDDYVGEVSVRVTDDLGMTDVAKANIIIKNSVPVAEIKESKTESLSEAFSFDLSFDDSGWLDSHTVSIDWGDGIVENVSINEENVFPESSGSISVTHRYLPVKGYTIKLSITDDNGGVGLAELTIESPKQIKIEALEKLKSIETDKPWVRKELDKALKNLGNSLNEKYWDDDFHLDSKSGSKMFNEEKQTIQSLLKILKTKELPVDSNVKNDVREVISQLIKSDILLLKVIISERDIELKKHGFQKMTNLGVASLKNKFEKFVQGTDFYNSEQAIDGFGSLWGAGKSLNFSTFNK